MINDSFEIHTTPHEFLDLKNFDNSELSGFCLRNDEPYFYQLIGRNLNIFYSPSIRVRSTEPHFTETLPIDNVKTISCNFDRDGKLFYAYQYGSNQVSIHYFNRYVNTMVSVEFSNAKSPLTFLNLRTSWENIGPYVFYIRTIDNTLCFRRSVDGFDIEYETIVLSSDEQLKKIGFTNTARVQITTSKTSKYLTYTAVLTNNYLPLLLADGKPLWIVDEVHDVK